MLMRRPAWRRVFFRARLLVMCALVGLSGQSLGPLDDFIQNHSDEPSPAELQKLNERLSSQMENQMLTHIIDQTLETKDGITQFEDGRERFKFSEMVDPATRDRIARCQGVWDSFNKECRPKPPTPRRSPQPDGPDKGSDVRTENSVTPSVSPTPRDCSNLPPGLKCGEDYVPKSNYVGAQIAVDRMIPPTVTGTPSASPSPSRSELWEALEVKPPVTLQPNNMITLSGIKGTMFLPGTVDLGGTHGKLATVKVQTYLDIDGNPAAGLVMTDVSTPAARRLNTRRRGLQALQVDPAQACSLSSNDDSDQQGFLSFETDANPNQANSYKECEWTLTTVDGDCPDADDAGTIVAGTKYFSGVDVLHVGNSPRQVAFNADDLVTMTSTPDPFPAGTTMVVITFVSGTNAPVQEGVYSRSRVTQADHEGFTYVVDDPDSSGYLFNVTWFAIPQGEGFIDGHRYAAQVEMAVTERVTSLLYDWKPSMTTVLVGGMSDNTCTGQGAPTCTYPEIRTKDFVGSSTTIVLQDTASGVDPASCETPIAMTPENIAWVAVGVGTACDDDPCGANAICIPKGPVYECVCGGGYERDGNGNCVAIGCPGNESASASPAPSLGASITPSQTPDFDGSISASPSESPPPSMSPSPAPENVTNVTNVTIYSDDVPFSMSPSNSTSPTPSISRTAEPTPSVSISASPSLSESNSLSASNTPNWDQSISNSPSISFSSSPSFIPSKSPVPSLPEEPCDIVKTVEQHFVDNGQFAKLEEAGKLRGYPEGFDSGIRAAYNELQRLRVSPTDIIRLDKYGRPLDMPQMAPKSYQVSQLEPGSDALDYDDFD